MSRRSAPMRSPRSRTLISLLPAMLALLAAQFVAGQSASQIGGNALILGVLGVTSWLLGLAWYGLPGMGLRGRRPLYAAIGFATLGWVAILVTRFLVPSAAISNTGAATVFVYLLLFEGLCVQLWAFGVLFRSVADWRGPLSAVLVSGIAFGVTGLLLFRESVWAQASGSAGTVWAFNAFSFFLLWGFFYGLVRLRTGSILGATLVQALQSFTAWNILLPASPPELAGYQQLYLVASLIFIILIWRLWPRRAADYRV